MSGCLAGKFSVRIGLLSKSTLTIVTLSQEIMLINKIYTFNSQGKRIRHATLDRWVNLINLLLYQACGKDSLFKGN